ncbi:MAG: HAD-IA family hydrolase [Nitrosomonas sp.]|nr:HAD-IA family hydrolase [Nitrosomonas sp.]MBP6075198.1 HAD-IA family hydrolase [Nitrosomonas sp.]
MRQDDKAKSTFYSRTFLFDIGRVLLDFDFESSLVKLIPERMDNAKERIQQVLGQKDTLEAGLIDPISYAKWALTVLESDATVAQFYQAWQQIFTVNKPMWRCIRQLAKKNHQLILLSNISAIHCPWIFTTYPKFSYFKHKVLSFEVGILKPELAIYQYAINTYRLDPSSTIYIDDQPQNITSGKKLGFQCWQYDLKNHQTFETWLEKTLATG